MCLKNKIQQKLAEKAALDDQIIKLEKLESATAPIKNILSELLKDYAETAPEDLSIVWQEILAIGQRHGLSVQPLAADELRQWEATKVENKKLKQQLEDSETIITEQDSAWGETSDQLDDAKVAFEKLKSDLEVHTQNLLPDLHEVWHKEEIGAEPKKLSQEAQEKVLTGEAYDRAVEEELALDDDNDVVEYEPDSAAVELNEGDVTDAVETILHSHGFFMPDITLEDCYDLRQKYEDYQGWAVYYSQSDQEGPVDGIGLYSKTFGFWDASTEMIGENDPTFPQHFTDYDTIVAWTQKVLDEVVAATPVENSEVPGQLALEFPELESGKALTGDEYDTAVEEELGCNWEDDDDVAVYEPDEACNKVPGQLALEFPNPVIAQKGPTKLQKLLANQNSFVFNPEETGAITQVSVNINSVIAPAENTVDQESEEAKIVVNVHECEPREYYIDAGTFLYQFGATLRQTAWGYAMCFLMGVKEETAIKEKIAHWNAQAISEENFEAFREEDNGNSEAETKFEAIGFNVQVYPQYAGKNLVGATFRFMSMEEKNAQGKPKLVFSTSQLAAEIGDRTWKVCASDLIQKYRDKEAARLEKLANPYAKEEDKFVELVKLSNDVGYLKEKATGKILAGYAAFSNKKADGKKTKTQAKARAQKWADFLKNSIQLECLPPRNAKRMVSEKTSVTFAYEVKIVKPSIGQLTKLAEEDLSLLPLELEDKQNLAEPQILELKSDNGSDKKKAIEKQIEPQSLTDNEVKIVESIRAALSRFNAEAVQEINSAEVPESFRDKAWESLSKEEQKTYELLLKLEFAQAPDFSVKTPEFTTSVDGKRGKSVFLSLRSINGVSCRVWRYQGQIEDGGYPCKESAAVAAWLQ